MLRSDVVIVELARLVVSQVDHTLGARSELHVLAQASISTGDLSLDLGANPTQADAKTVEDSGGDAVILSYKTQQQMLGRDVVLSEPAGFFLCEEGHAR